MIRVNLLKKIGEGSDFESVKINFSPIQILLKFVFLILFVVPIGYYENYNVKTLKGKNERLRLQIKDLSNLVGEKKKNISEAEKVSKKIDQLEVKEKILMELAKKRSQLIKILDHFQNVIPNKVWFKRLAYDQDKVQIIGNSVDNENVTQFIRFLEEGDLLKSVNLERSFYSGQGKSAVLEFELTCHLKES